MVASTACQLYSATAPQHSCGIGNTINTVNRTRDCHHLNPAEATASCPPALPYPLLLLAPAQVINPVHHWGRYIHCCCCYIHTQAHGFQLLPLVLLLRHQHSICSRQCQPSSYCSISAAPSASSDAAAACKCAAAAAAAAAAASAAAAAAAACIDMSSAASPPSTGDASAA